LLIYDTDCFKNSLHEFGSALFVHIFVSPFKWLCLVFLM